MARGPDPARETILCGPPALTEIQTSIANQAEDLIFCYRTSEDKYTFFALHRVAFSVFRGERGALCHAKYATIF